MKIEITSINLMAHSMSHASSSDVKSIKLEKKELNNHIILRGI